MNNCILVKIVTYLKCDIPLKLFRLTSLEDEMLSCVVPEFSWKNVLFDEKPYFDTIWDAVRYAIHSQTVNETWHSFRIKVTSNQTPRFQIQAKWIEVPFVGSQKQYNPLGKHRCRTPIPHISLHQISLNTSIIVLLFLKSLNPMHLLLYRSFVNMIHMTCSGTFHSDDVTFYLSLHCVRIYSI